MAIKKRQPEQMPNLPAGYEYVKELAAGAQGSVWLVLNKNMGVPGRQEAVKVLHQITEKDRQRFGVEISTLANLSHPNIVTIYYANPQESYFIMEFLEGGTLHTFLHQEDFSLLQGLQILSRVAEGLHFAHSKGLIHRDLKPQNILFTASKIPKITDFGLVKAVTVVPQDGMTAPQISLGTPNYISPEQWEDSKSVDYRSDIWALGVILYQMLARRLPFEGETMANLMYATLMKPIAPPHLLRADFSPLAVLAEPICMQALSKNREQRPQSALEIAKSLRAVLQKQAEADKVSTGQANVPSPEMPYFPKLKISPAKKSEKVLLDFADEEPVPPPVNKPTGKGKLSRVQQIGISTAALLVLLVAWIFLKPPSLSQLQREIVSASNARKLEVLKILENRQTNAWTIVALALNSKDSVVHERAVRILEKAGKQAVPDLVTVLENESEEYTPDALISVAKLLGMLQAQEAERPIYALAVSSKTPDNLRQVSIESLLSIAPKYQKYYRIYEGVWYTHSELDKKGFIELEDELGPAVSVLAKPEEQLRVIRKELAQLSQSKQSDYEKLLYAPGVQVIPVLLEPWASCAAKYREILKWSKKLATYELKYPQIKRWSEETGTDVAQLFQELTKLGEKLQRDKAEYALEIYKYTEKLYNQSLAWEWPDQQKWTKLCDERLNQIADLRNLIAKSSLQREEELDAQKSRQPDTDVIYLNDGSILKGWIERERRAYIWVVRAEKDKITRQKIATQDVKKIDRMPKEVRNAMLERMKQGQ